MEDGAQPLDQRTQRRRPAQRAVGPRRASGGMPRTVAAAATAAVAAPAAGRDRSRRHDRCEPRGQRSAVRPGGEGAPPAPSARGCNGVRRGWRRAGAFRSCVRNRWTSSASTACGGRGGGDEMRPANLCIGEHGGGRGAGGAVGRVTLTGVGVVLVGPHVPERLRRGGGGAVDGCCRR